MYMYICICLYISKCTYTYILAHINMYIQVGKDVQYLEELAVHMHNYLHIYIDLYTDTITNTYINECIYKCPHSYVLKFKNI
jgi:hypothetical protein